MKNNKNSKKSMRVALVVPHIFMHREILPHVIFSPGELAIALADGLAGRGVKVTLYTPGPVDSRARNITADLSLFDRELAGRGEHGDTYLDLMRKHPFTFVTLARQVQSEIVARAYRDANDNRVDVVHVYTNEEEIALAFAGLCKKPVVFTHHDPFNFLVKYKNNLPKYKHLSWISLSLAQRLGMPKDTNWVANIYHGLHETALKPVDKPKRDYVAYLGRIIEPKGVHLAIAAVRKYNETAKQPLTLRIAGKHYAEESKDKYWQEKIVPALDDPHIVYDGFIESLEAKQDFLGNAGALLVPSLFDEPFGMVTLEAFACGTPVIALDSGALPEVIENGVSGLVIKKAKNWNGKTDELATIQKLTTALGGIDTIDSKKCLEAYRTRFSFKKMVEEHLRTYWKITRR